MRRADSLAKPLNTLLLGLAVYDLCRSLLRRAYGEVRKRTNNSEIRKCSSKRSIFPYHKLLSALALTVNRFLAIHFHLRYQQVVTCKRSFAAVISLFMISASLSCVGFWVTHAFTNSFRNSLPYDKFTTLLPHLFSSSTPQKSNACTASSTRNCREWREKIECKEGLQISEKHILRVPDLFHLLFTSDVHQCNLN